MVGSRDVCGWASHIESMQMIRHRPHEGDRRDDESNIDSSATPRRREYSAEFKTSVLEQCRQPGASSVWFESVQALHWVTASTRTWCTDGYGSIGSAWN
jgi:hypothetical protein